MFCPNVDVALATAFQIFTSVKGQRTSNTYAKIAICLTRETNGALEGKLKDIAFCSVEHGASSIILSSQAREHLMPNISYDIEDLGFHWGAILRQCFRAFKITERQKIEPSPFVATEALLATVAVLPLTARTPGDDKGMIGELIADDIVSELSPSSELRVIARLSTTNLRVQQCDLASIASYLNANFVVSGSYAVSGFKLRIYLELSDVMSQSILWSDHMDFEIAEVTQGVAAIEEVGARIRQAISVHETRRVQRFPLNSLQNYTLLISAINLMHRLFEDNFMRAYDILQELISRCPNHPEPLAWIGRWYVLRVQGTAGLGQGSG